MAHARRSVFLAVLAVVLLLPATHATGKDAVTLDELAGATLPADAVWLESLDLSFVEQEWSTAKAGRSVDGKPLTIGGQVFAHGIGSHANAEWTVTLHGAARTLHAAVGVDAEAGEHGTVVFVVLVDDVETLRTPVMKGGDAPRVISVDLTGAAHLTLIVEDGGDHIHYDHADWGGAMLVLDPTAAKKPEAVRPPEDPAPDIVHPAPTAPEIHAPRITGATPGRPFLFKIPASGEGPLRFEAEGLPKGLVLDPKTGILTGALVGPGRTDVAITAVGPRGCAQSTLTIVGGDHTLALTPPMGWNSWNVWGTSVDDEKVRAAARGMVESGLAAYGYQYVNIDDAWEGTRDAAGRLQPNEKFPDMRGLADYVHSLGLKLGLYSSPGSKTCAGYEGSYQHEQIDAQTWADWGIDYLKYDWCSYGQIAKDGSRPEHRKPYAVMRQALDQVDRDVVYSLCQYGMDAVWEWGADVGGNTWRTTGDIRDAWSSMAGIGFGQAGKEGFASPGHWNDPDMLVVGHVGWGPTLHPSKLTPNEQITHISLWSLLASPLLIGCDLTQLDAFTRSLLTNPEVLEVNQDPLGRQAWRVLELEDTEVWARPLLDGSWAVGLFNRGRRAAVVAVRWSDLDLEGPHEVRDLWLRKDLGAHTGAFGAEIPRHGALLLRIR